MQEINSSLKAWTQVKHHMNFHSEEFYVLCLNPQLKIIHQEMLFRGTVDQCLIHPRDIFRVAISHNASSLILAHNHPSLCVTPSTADKTITKNLLKAAAILQIPILDHLIFTSDIYFSMADAGLFKKWQARNR